MINDIPNRMVDQSEKSDTTFNIIPPESRIIIVIRIVFVFLPSGFIIIRGYDLNQFRLQISFF